MSKVKQVAREVTLSFPKSDGSLALRTALGEARRGMYNVQELIRNGERIDFEVTKVEPDPDNSDNVLITVRADVRKES